MTAKVYFCDFKARSDKDATVNKIKRMFDKAGFSRLLQPLDLTAIKIHFGEKGNDGYINPVYVRQVVDKIKESKAKPFVTDTNTLYLGSRHNAVDHLVTALEHGFNYTVLNAPIMIADGLKSNGFVEVEMKLKHFYRMKIAKDILDADAMIVMSHVKGHEMAGFGGAIKNLAMGCAPAAGKKDQHSLRPVVELDKCIGCRQCTKVCPAGAITITEKKARIDPMVCIGCADCINDCPVKAIDISQQEEIVNFIERMVEYAKGAVAGKEGKIGYINFLNKISPCCDCMGHSDRALVPDIGILFSTDPVAIDMASVDLVNRQEGFENSQLRQGAHKPGCDKFLGVHPDKDPMLQINYAVDIGLGSKDYELVSL